MDGQTSPTDSGDPTARFAHLLEQVVADDLAPERRAELAALMQAQPEFVRKYAEAVHLRECLRDYAANNEAGLPPEPATTDAGVSAAPSSRAPHISKPKEASRLKVGWFPLALATCLALAVGLSVGRLAPTVGTAAGRGENASIGQPSGPRPLVAIGDSTRDRLGTITALSPEASSDGLLRALQVGDQLRRGEVIQLTRGVMRVGFAAGPEVIVQGPAEFSVVDDLAMYVHRGRVRTTAKGRFTLQTALMAAKSEGAELALVTTADQSVEVFAYSGHAEISSNPHSNVEPEVLRKLGGGQGVLVSRQGASTRLTAVDAGEPAGVVRDWLEINERLHPYERLVLADDPMAYWPLYRVRRNRRVLDLTQHGYDGQAIGNWPAELSDAASTQVRGAYFDGESYIEPDAKPPVDLESGFTIEGWAKVMGGPEYQAVFTSRWVFASNTPTQQCFGFTLYAGNDDRWQFWSGSGEYGALWQTLSGDEPLERHEWTHVAASFRPQAVQDGEWVEGVVELYVNGQKAAEGVHRLSLLDFEWPARIGAAEFVPKSLTSWLFQGELRDVALYDYPLSPERLKAHHAEGEKAT